MYTDATTPCPQGKLANFENAVRHVLTGRVPAHQLLDRAAVQVGQAPAGIHRRHPSPTLAPPLCAACHFAL